MDELLAGFLEEAEELLENLDRAALVLERDPGNDDAIRDLFRSAHTLKGAAGLVGATEISEVTHLLEEALENVLAGRLPFTSNLADLLFKGFDYVRELVALLASGMQADPARHDEMLAALGALRGTGRDPVSNVMPQEDPGNDYLIRLPADTRAEILKASEREGMSVYQVILKFDPEIFYTGQDPLVILCEVLRCGDIVSFVCHTERLPALEELDPERVYIWFEIYLLAPPGMLSELKETVEFLDPASNQILFRELKEEIPALLHAAERPQDGDTEVIREILRQQRIYIEQNRGHTGSVSSLLKVLSRIAGAVGRQDLMTRLQGEPAPEWDDIAGIVSLLESVLPEAETERDAIAAGSMHGSASADPLDGVGSGRGPASASHDAGGRRFIRIAENQLERLFELSGELTVAKNSIPYLVRRLEVYWGIPEAARELKEKYQVLEQISRDLQDMVMGLRLIPASQIFRRFPRFVRDVSRDLGKRVRFIIEGEETRIDKTVLERVYEPLLHIVRNSLDHGLEPPEERSAAGKDPEGKLFMRAGQDGHTVFIEVEDDGRGIDPARVKESAVEKGVIAPGEASQIPDDEAVQLIFEPGFSTKKEVSELSGRGVGMDVVRDTADSLGGSVRLKNTPGAGLTVRLELPLTVATTRVLVVRCGDSRYGIPMEDVQEVVRAGSGDLHSLGVGEGLCLRGRVVAVTHLKEILGLGHTADSGSHCIIILRSGSGVVVDALEREVEILLKPLPGEMGNIELYTGASILSDGSVLLVLNPRELASGGMKQ